MVIGIDHYGNGIPELNTAVNDARRLGEMLASLHGYEVTALLDAEATGERITTLLTDELPKTVGHNDRLLFYFAGHGVAASADEGPNGYLLPADARRGADETFLQMPKVHDALLALNCRHMLVVLDSCFSGAFRWSGAMRDLEPMAGVVHREKYDRFVRDPAWQVITSASQDQKALDQLMTGALGGRGEAGAHSPFAQALFDAISGAGDVVPRGQGDGLVTATELYLYLEEALTTAVAAVGKRQTPRLWPLKKHDKGEFVFFVPGKELSLPPAPPLTFDRNPWVGLSSYDASSSSLFFGRDAEIAGLRETIAAKPLTVVVGASGTGKSSLVKAGVVPRLQADGWHALPNMRPGSNALASLAKAVSPATGPGIAATPTAIAARVAALVAEHGTTPVLLVIDQFEELITLAESADERHAALDLLAQLVTTHAGTFRLVVTIRTDFEPNFDRTAFGERWLAGRYVIPPMSRESLRAVIEKPAEARVLYFEPSALVDRLLDEVVATPGALPLLSFALSEMYIEFVKRQGSDRAITAADVGAVGGVAGALRSRADREYAALAPAEQETLRRVMLRMVAVESSGLARRRITDAELDFADPGERSRATAVVKRFTDARLLVEGREADSESFVEPAHDALVRGWGELQTWIRREQGAPFSLQQQRLLTRSTAEWDRAPAGERDGLLWRDAARSAQLRPLVRTQAVWLTERELAFARRSIRGRNLARATAAAAVLLIAIGGVAATIAGFRASRRAEENRIASIVRSAQAAATEDPLLAAQILGNIDSAMVEQLDDGTRLSLIATTMQLNSAPQVEWTFGDGSPLTQAVISEDGNWIVDAAEEGSVHIRDLNARKTHFLSLAFASTFRSPAFDAAGTLLAAGTTDGEVLLQCLHQLPAVPKKAWTTATEAITTLRLNRAATRMLTIDTAGRALVLPLPHPCDPATPADTEVTPVITVRGAVQAEFIAGDGIVVTDSTGGFTIVSPDGRTRRRGALAPARPYASIAVSPDGHRIALASADGTLRATDLRPNGGVDVLLRDDPVMSLAFSSDGTTLVSAHNHSGVHRWDFVDGSTRQEYETQEDPHELLSFEPGGPRFIGASVFGRHVTVFDASGKSHRLNGHKDQVLAASVTHGGQRMVTVCRDGSIWVWRPAVPVLHHDAPQLEPERVGSSNVSAIAFAPDSRHVALGTSDGFTFRYALDSVAEAQPFDRDSVAIRALRWGPDGHSLHALREDGSRIQWQWTSERLTKRVVGPAIAHGLRATIPDASGRRVTALSLGGEATVWDLDTNRPPFRTRVLDSLFSCPPGTRLGSVTAGDIPECAQVPALCLAIAANANRLATCLGDSITVVATDGQVPPRTFSMFQLNAGVGALSPDGSQLAASADSTILLWRTDGASADPLAITVGVGPVQLLAFSPDGKMLAARHGDGRVRVIDLRTKAPVLTVRTAGDNIDGLQFSPDGRHLVAFAFAQREARVWNVRGSSGALPVKVSGLSVRTLAISPDAKWLVVADDDQTAQLVPLDAHLALAPFRRVRECLPAALRERYLLETARQATRRADACVRPASREIIARPVSRTS